MCTRDDNENASVRPEMIAQGILRTAVMVISGDRQDQYGAPEDSFQEIANYWNIYLAKRGMDYPLNSSDIAHLMGLLKIARMRGQKYHRDNYVDACGYFALAAQMREKEGPQC